MIELRDYQSECVKAIDGMKSGSGLVCMATGLGKTVVFTDGRDLEFAVLDFAAGAERAVFRDEIDHAGFDGSSVGEGDRAAELDFAGASDAKDGKKER